MKKRQQRVGEGAVLGTLAAAIAAALGSAARLHAQEPGAEEILVTGSRIVRRDFEANSPIMTIDATSFEESSTIAIESVLNKMPQFVPAASQFESDGTGAGGTTSGITRSPGASFVSLRGLGTHRNLVLLDGRRAMPINGSMAVNVNNIPSAAIARIETITGGASSVYGADAMTGVVNFVLKRDFEGLEFDAQYGETQEGDAEEERYSVLFGANLADGRGNVMLGLEHGERGALRAVDRDFYNEGFADPTVVGPGRMLNAGIAVVASNAPSQAVVNQIFNQLPPGSVARTGTFNMNDDGTVFKTTPAGSYRYNGPLVDPDGVVWRKYHADGRLIQNRGELTAQLPLERFSLFGRGEYKLTDNVRVFGQGLFTDTTSYSFGTFNGLVGGWSATVPHGSGIYAASIDANGNTLAPYLPGGLYALNCPPVGGCTNSQVFPKPPEINMLLDSRPRPNDLVQTYENPVWQGPKTSRSTTSVYQVITGLEGDFGDGRDLTWELYTSHGRSVYNSLVNANARLYGFRWLVNQPNYGRGLVYQTNPEQAGFAGGTVYCTSGIPMFYGPPNNWTQAYPYLNPTQGVPTQDCLDTVEVKVKNNGLMEQSVSEFNLQGGAFNLPAGQARFAAGVSYRKNTYEFVPEGLATQQAIVDSIAGTNPVDASFGETSAFDTYAELLIPLLADKRGAEELTLELGYRRSDNEPDETVDTYKALVDWRITDRVRFRGGNQKANRAPNVAELFQASEQTRYDSPRGDWCSQANPANPLSPNQALNPNAAQAELICRARMGPDAAETYYSNVQNNAVIQSRWLNTIGNPNLNSEKADTFTAGVVANIGEQVRLSVDYWNIEIREMVSAENVDTIWTHCMSPITNPTFDPTHPQCARITRDPVDGDQVPYFVTFTNEAAIDAAGYDLQLDWSGTVGPGTVSVNFLASILDSIKTRTEPDADWNEWTGSSGPTDISAIQGMSYDYRTFTTTSYSQGPWSVSVRWRHLPSIKSEAMVLNPAGSSVPTNAYEMFDVAGRYAFDRFDVRFGIDNLFNTDPELTFPDATTSAKGSTHPGFYDILGRRYYIGLNFGF